MNISPTLNVAWQLAAQETVAARKPEIGPVQMFCGITKVSDILYDPGAAPHLMTAADLDRARAEIAAALTPLMEQGVELTTFRRALRARVGVGEHQHPPQVKVGRSQVLKTLFDRAQILCGPNDTATIEARHLIAAMLEDRNLLVTSALSEQSIDVDVLLPQLRDPQGTPSPRPERKPNPKRKFASGPTPYLNEFCRDLSALARAGALGPIIGRRAEVLQVMQILLRRTKCNPVLVGEAGVGKTAVAELLAIRLAGANCPEGFRNSRVLELTMGNLLAGASKAGEREMLIQGIIKECQGNPDVVLFIDELHTLVKAGGVGGAVDPADLFKPALARGELKCLGATTCDEYARYIEADPALERRFDRVVVVEPTREEALAILAGLRQTLETHHGVILPDDALQAAVDLSIRYDTAHQLPDKAIDLLDLASAQTRLPQLSVVGDPARASVIRMVVERKAVATVLARKLGLPVDLLLHSSASDLRLEGLQAQLMSRLVGQDDAVKRVAQRLALTHANLRERRGPLGVFLFLGPTGVGKTELARSLAHFLFGDERSLIRLDMSEYKEEHSTAKLIGAPPGYVGHEEQGQLTGALRKKPYSVVLLDEVDKAHPGVFDLFLQLFDEGRLTDSKGRTADARHAIFIMTGNIPVTKVRGIGFVAESGHADAESLAKARFRAEFLNRVDELIEFRPLSPEHIEKLVGRTLEEIARSARQHHGVEIRFAPDVPALVAEQGFSEEYGVRHLQRTVETLIDMPVAALLRHGAKSSQLSIQSEGGAITLHWA